MKNIFQTAATIESISTRKDRSIKIVVGTQELNAEQMSSLMLLNNQIGWFLFSEAAMQTTDIPEEPPEFGDTKSLSEQLRNVLYIFWREKTDQKQPFNEFRRAYMEKLINHWKDKINE